MSRLERTGIRDLTFSNWHRQALPDRAHMIDVDGLHFCRRCRMPLALLETARDIGQATKATIVLERLAAVANIPAYCLLYSVSPNTCATPRCRAKGCDHGIAEFRFRRVHPAPTEFEVRAPADVAEHLTRIHDAHEALICALTREVTA